MHRCQHSSRIWEINDWESGENQQRIGFLSQHLFKSSIDKKPLSTLATKRWFVQAPIFVEVVIWTFLAVFADDVLKKFDYHMLNCWDKLEIELLKFSVRLYFELNKTNNSWPPFVMLWNVFSSQNLHNLHTHVSEFTFLRWSRS